jgi:hypothetical protein
MEDPMDYQVPSLYQKGMRQTRENSRLWVMPQTCEEIGIHFLLALSGWFSFRNFGMPGIIG